MPKLFLHPLVENAYTHGMDNAKGASQIELNFTYEEGKLSLSIEDNGRGLEDETLASLRERLNLTKSKNEVSSIFNLRRRLDFMYGDNAKMEVKRGNMGGLRVEVEISFLEDKNEYWG